jgi:hypothetical protein
MAASEGISHQVLVTEILHLAADRYQFPAASIHVETGKYRMYKSIFTSEVAS